MRRKTLWILLAVALGVLSATVSYRVSRARAQGGEWSPFTAVMAERNYLREGTGCATCAAPVAAAEDPRLDIYIYATRRDGAWVRDFKRPIMLNREWGDLRTVIDYSAGTRTGVDPSTESVTTYHYAADEVARESTRPRACSPDPNAPHATLLGYDTVVVESTYTSSKSSLVQKVTEWRAPQLNCFALKQTIDHRAGGSRFEITREALLVKEGDPSSALFEIPAGYVERSPSENMAERDRRFPNEAVASPAAASMEQFDRAYRAAQKTR